MIHSGLHRRESEARQDASELPNQAIYQCLITGLKQISEKLESDAQEPSSTGEAISTSDSTSEATGEATSEPSTSTSSACNAGSSNENQELTNQITQITESFKAIEIESYLEAFDSTSSSSRQLDIHADILNYVLKDNDQEPVNIVFADDIVEQAIMKKVAPKKNVDSVDFKNMSLNELIFILCVHMHHSMDKMIDAATKYQRQMSTTKFIINCFIRSYQVIVAMWARKNLSTVPSKNSPVLNDIFFFSKYAFKMYEKGPPASFADDFEYKSKYDKYPMEQIIKNVIKKSFERALKEVQLIPHPILEAHKNVKEYILVSNHFVDEAWYVNARKLLADFNNYNKIIVKKLTVENFDWLSVVKTFKSYLTLEEQSEPFKIILGLRVNGDFPFRVFNGYTLDEFISVFSAEQALMEERYNGPDQDRYNILFITFQNFQIQYGSGRSQEVIYFTPEGLIQINFPNTFKRCLTIASIISQEGPQYSASHPLLKKKASLVDIETYYKKQIKIITCPEMFEDREDTIFLFNKDSHIGWIQKINNVPEATFKPLTHTQKTFSTTTTSLVFYDMEFSWDTTNPKACVAKAPSLIAFLVFRDNKFTMHIVNSIVKFINHLICLSSKGTVDCYAHNASHIEHHFIIESLIKDFHWGERQQHINLPFTEGSKIKHFVYDKNINFYDSMKYLPMALDQLKDCFNTNISKNHKELDAFLEHYKDYINPDSDIKNSITFKLDNPDPNDNYILNSPNWIGDIVPETNSSEADSSEADSSEDIDYKKKLKATARQTLKEINTKNKTSLWYLLKKWDINSPEDRRYVANDVLNLATCLFKFNTEIGNLTEHVPFKKVGELKWYLEVVSISSIGKTEIFNKHPDIIASEEVNKYFTQTYRGGRCYIHPTIRKAIATKQEPIIEIDINSSYPFQVAQEAPGRLLFTTKDIHDSRLRPTIWAMFCKYSYKQVQDIGILQDYSQAKASFPRDTNTRFGLIWSFEHEFLKEELDIEDITIIFAFEKISLNQTISKWYHLKKTATDPCTRMIMKYLLNSTLGSLGMNPFKEHINIFRSDHSETLKKLERKQNVSICLHEDMKIMKTTELTPNKKSSPHLTSYMTAKARLQMITKLKEINTLSPDVKVLYGDTDSLFVQAPAQIIDSIIQTCSNEIGQWDYKHHHYITVSKPKQYTKDHIPVCSGLPKNIFISAPSKDQLLLKHFKWVYKIFRPELHYEEQIRHFNPEGSQVDLEQLELDTHEDSS